MNDIEFQKLATAVPPIRRMLGCGWGRVVQLPEDTDTCDLQAVQIIVMHEGDKEYELRLCAKHRDLVLENSEPHHG